MRIICIIFGIVVLLWFLLPFMVAGILNIGNITGIVVALLFTLYMIFMPMVHEWLNALWQMGNMKWVLSGCGALVVGIAILVHQSR